jgi:hypothetical protein
LRPAQAPTTRHPKPTGIDVFHGMRATRELLELGLDEVDSRECVGQSRTKDLHLPQCACVVVKGSWIE